MDLSRGREMGSLLMHVSIPTSQAFSLIFVFFFSFFLFFFLVLPLFLFVIHDPPSLFTTTTFYTICHEMIYHFYPSPAFGLLWASFQDCPLACQLPSHYHCTVLVAPCLIPRQKWLVLSLTSLYYHYSHLDKG